MNEIYYGFTITWINPALGEAKKDKLREKLLKDGYKPIGDERTIIFRNP